MRLHFGTVDETIREVPVPSPQGIRTGRSTAPRAEGGAGTSRADGWEGHAPARPNGFTNVFKPCH